MNVEGTPYAPSDQQLRDLRVRFTHHPPRPDQIPRYDELRHSALEFALRIAHLTPPGREQAQALSSLELCVMQANAAIARGER